MDIGHPHLRTSGSQYPPGRNVVQPVQHQVTAGDDLPGIVLVQIGADRLYLDPGVNALYPGLGGLGLGTAHQRLLTEQLPVEITLLKHIPIHRADVAHADTGQQLDQIAADAAAADNGHPLAPQQPALLIRQGRDVPFIASFHVQPPPTGGNSATMSPSFTSVSGVL